MQTPEPFDYQEECLRALAADDSPRQLIVMATGLGKTFTAAFALKQRLESDPGPVLVLCHQNDILDQWEKALRLVLGNEVSYGRYHGGAPKDRDAQVLLASFQSMSNGRKEFARDRFHHVIVDESHHGPAPTYRPTIEYFAPHARLLGLTATPERADDLDIKEIFGAPTYELSLEDALGRGKLTPVRYLVLTDGVLDLKSIPTDLGALNINQLNRMFFAVERDDRIVNLISEHVRHLGDDLNMMVFCESKAHADRFERLLPNSWAVHSDHLPHWQENRIADYLKGKKNTLVTVNKFNEGVDYPATNVVALLRRHGTRSGFLQQIGRALRPSPNKKEVIILDFAGNCERMLWIDELRRTAKEKNDQYASASGGTGFEPFEASVGIFEFDVISKHILDVLADVRGGYTKESLISQLIKKADELGRTPTAVEVNSDPAMANAVTFMKYFGGWNKALQAAGLEPVVKFASYTREELIAQLNKKAAELGRAPSSVEVNADTSMANSTTFIKAFGGWNKALMAAGLKPVNMYNYFTKEILVDQLKRKIHELGRAPTMAEVNDDPEMASMMTFSNIFGSWMEALLAAGLSPVNLAQAKLHIRYSKEELIAQLKRKALELGKVPTTTAIEKDFTMASYRAFVRCFGSWHKALKAADLIP